MQRVEDYIESDVKMLNIGINDLENAFAAEKVDTLCDSGKIDRSMRDIFFSVANDAEQKQRLEEMFDRMVVKGTMSEKGRVRWQRILDSLAAPLTNPEPADDDDMDSERETEATSVLKDHSAKTHTPNEIVGIRLHDVSLRGPLDGSAFKRASFPGCYFGGTSMKGVKVLHSDFETAEIRGADMSPNGKDRTVIVSANFGDMIDSKLDGSVVVNADMTVAGLSLRDAILVAPQIRPVVRSGEEMAPFAEDGIHNTWFIGGLSLPEEVTSNTGANLISQQAFLDLVASGGLEQEIERFVKVNDKRSLKRIRKDWSKRLMEVYQALKGSEI